MYDGFFNTPASMPLLSNARTRSISAENPTGEKGAGALATTGNDLEMPVLFSFHIAARCMPDGNCQ